jgi:hypothetical protein
MSHLPSILRAPFLHSPPPLHSPSFHPNNSWCREVLYKVRECCWWFEAGGEARSPAAASVADRQTDSLLADHYCPGPNRQYEAMKAALWDFITTEIELIAACCVQCACWCCNPQSLCATTWIVPTFHLKSKTGLRGLKRSWCQLFCIQSVTDQRDGSLRPYSLLSTPEPLLFLPSSYKEKTILFLRVSE